MAVIVKNHGQINVNCSLKCLHHEYRHRLSKTSVRGWKAESTVVSEYLSMNATAAMSNFAA